MKTVWRMHTSSWAAWMKPSASINAFCASIRTIPLAQYHLAQAYRRKGQTGQARAAYERFLQIWKGADADFPEVVDAKRELLKLSPGGRGM